MGPTLDTFALGSTTQTAGTVITQLVHPWRGTPGNTGIAYRLTGGSTGKATWMSNQGAHTHIDSLIYTAGSTAHDVVVMRPLNYAVVNGDVAANGTVVTLYTDPGLYQTAGNYKYPLPPDATVPSQAANNGIAANDYVCVQLRDNTWHLSKVTSVSGLAVTLTTAIPNVTGGGVKSGSILFYFGASTDTVPQSGAAHVAFTSVASARTDLLAGSRSGPSFKSFNPGDPLLVYSANASNAGILSSVLGHYARV
jgi:hypothetical protein